MLPLAADYADDLRTLRHAFFALFLRLYSHVTLLFCFRFAMFTLMFCHCRRY